MVYESICEELLLLFELFSFSMRVQGEFSFLLVQLLLTAQRKGERARGRSEALLGYLNGCRE